MIRVVLLKLSYIYIYICVCVCIYIHTYIHTLDLSISSFFPFWLITFLILHTYLSFRLKATVGRGQCLRLIGQINLQI